MGAEQVCVKVLFMSLSIVNAWVEIVSLIDRGNMVKKDLELC